MVKRVSYSHDIKNLYTGTKTNKSFLDIYTKIKESSELKDYEIAKNAEIPLGSFARIKYGYVPTHRTTIEKIKDVLNSLVVESNA